MSVYLSFSTVFLSFSSILVSLSVFVSFFGVSFEDPPYPLSGKFQPLPLFTLLPHSGIRSFRDPATPTTTGGPSFISTSIFRTFFTTSQHRSSSRSCWQTLRPHPEGFLGPTSDRVAESINMVKPTTNRLHYD